MVSKRSDQAIVIALAQRIGVSDIAGRYDGAGNVIHMSLSSCNLTHFPLEVLQLQHLQRLFLHQNQLRELPAAIGELKGLQLLGLSHNPLHGRLDGIPPSWYTSSSKRKPTATREGSAL